jgi:AraC-like DNA-binding protein
MRFIDAEIPYEILRGTFVHQRFAPHSHDTYAVGTIERGTSRLQFMGREAIRRAGDLVTIAPGDVHTGEAADSDGWSYRMFYIPAALMARFAGNGAPPAFAESGVYDPDLAEQITSAHMLLESAASGREKAAVLERVMSELCERHAIQGVTRAEDARRHRMITVRQYLEDHFEKPVRLEQVAEMAHIGTFHLIREFRHAFGIPPYRYLELVRVTRAREMLRAGHRLSHVAFSTGFSDQSHLTRQFKRVFGVPPGHYARSYARAR